MRYKEVFGLLNEAMYWFVINTSYINGEQVAHASLMDGCVHQHNQVCEHNISTLIFSVLDMS